MMNPTTKEIIAYSNTLHVMYIEDNLQNIISTKPLFEDLFKSVTIGKNGREGLSLYEAYHQEHGRYFDLIITDIKMPDLNGIELIKAIYKKHPKQKIFVISAYRTEEYLVPIINLRIDGFIKKPLSLEQLLNLIGKLYEQEKEKIIELPEGYCYDFFAKKLLRGDEIIKLTKKEVRLLELFLDNPQSYFSLEEIFAHLFVDDPSKEFSNNAVHGILKRLKAKVSYALFSNNRTQGYKIIMLQEQA